MSLNYHFKNVDKAPSLCAMWITGLSSAERDSQEKVRDRCGTEGGLTLLNKTAARVTDKSMMLTCSRFILVHE